METAKLGKKSNLVIRSRVKNWCNVWSVGVITEYGHPPEYHVTLGRGASSCLIRSPYRPRNFLRDDSKRSLTYPCPRSLLENRIALRINFSRGASSVVSDELWDKNEIGGEDGLLLLRNWKLCNNEIKIVTRVSSSGDTSDRDNDENLGYQWTMLSVYL